MRLPKLLRVNALADKDCTVDPDWHRRVICPVDIAGGESKGNLYKFKLRRDAVLLNKF